MYLDSVDSEKRIEEILKKISVVAAIIVHKGKILCVQRGVNDFEYISKKYEFPGGKIEEGETTSQTVIREIYEELEMKIQVKEPFLTVNHQYPDFLLTMYSHICSCENPRVTLNEHIDYKWLRPEELSDLDWAEADIPIVEKLVQQK